MKLTKKLEAEVLKAYKTYWEAYLRGDMKTFASFLADNITVFGTAVSENFNNKKETLRFYKATADQLVGKAQFRNRNIKIRAVDENILLNEQCDFYVLIEGKWTFYGYTRITSILKQTNSGWKLAHQHASFPDTRAEEGEQMAAEKIKEENIQLRDAVKRRTIELEEKNRELEIEAAVERVRAKALAMHSSEDIHAVVRTLRNELFGLNLEGITAVTICLKRDDGRVRLWDITDLEDTGRYTWDVTFTMNEIDPRLWIRQIWSSKKKIIAFEQDSNDLKRTLKWLSQYDKKTADEITELIRVNKIKRGWHRAVKLANGRLITDFINEPPTEIESILLKMGAAFDLAYKRFLDLKNAEAQTREAQIELALERVRARAMAMHNSNELAELVSTVFNELTQLGFRLTSCIIWIHDHLSTKNTLWIASTEMNKPAEPFLVNVFHNDFFKSINHAWKSKDTKWVYTFTGKEKKNFEKAFFKEIPQLPIHLKNALRMPEQVVFSASFNNFGALEIVETEALTDEKFEILHRFGKVFDSSYTRFNDLQKAEAQAREAQIETGLERVRSKTMAMHKSEEVTGIAVSLNEELLKLGFEGGSTIIIIDKETGDTEQWTGFSEDKTLQSCYVPNFKHPYHNALLDGWKRGENFLVYTVTGKEKKTLDEHYFTTGYKDFPESDKRWMRQMASVTFSHAFMKYGAIHWGPDHLTEEQLRILQRFSKVFEQSYTRFLDLQKAEVQTREATIETSLERVRASSMAMHNSNDLLSVVNVLGEQLRQLGFQADAVSFITDGDEKGYNMWLSSPGDSFLSKIYVPRINDRTTILYNEAKEQGRDFYSYILTKDEKDFYFKNFFENTILRNYPHEGKQAVYDAPGMATTNVILEKIVLSISNFSAIPYTEQDNIIIKRFAFVFQQSYTRFLDLQKAEAQAREAQVELALERVRARTMAMQKSDELREAVLVIYQQLQELEFGAQACNIIIIDKDTGDEQFWVAGFTQEIYPESYHVPRLNHHYQDDQFTAWRNGLKYAVFEYTGREKKKFDKIFFTQTDFRNVPEQAKEFMIGLESVKLSTAFTTYGSLQILGPDALSEEKANILKRFAKVFEQTYTRFLDLQKAEAQAREAQIEAALERVRSRSMAMHKSDDLHEVIKVVIEQLSLLSVKFNVANFAKIDPDGSWDLWLSTPDQAYPALIHVPYLDHPIFNDITEQVAKKNDFHTNVYNQEETTIFFHHFFENTIAKNTPEERKQFVYSSKGLSRSLFLTKNIWFSVSRYDATPFMEEENAIFKRFANVFEQAYTRFLDLQKAEEQAREADIELSLERVRAKTMAMQKPSEFVDVINIIGEQFVHLGFDIDWANFGANGFAISEGIDIWNFAVIPGTSPISARVFIPYFDHPVFTNSAANINEFLNGGRDLITVTFDKQTKDTWLDHLFTKTIFKDVPEEYRAIQYAKSGYTTSNISVKDTWLSIGKFDSRPFTEEQQSILRRFAKAFGQANTRFLDLQKAEAQAREAQIEASLERVRSRAMAMQNSDELKELIGTVFTELTKLDIVLTRCLIMIYDPRSNDSIWWMANSEAPTEPIGLRIQNHGHSPYVAYLKAWQEKKLKWVYVLEGAVKKDWDDFLFVETELSHLPDFVIAGMKAPERVYLNSSFNSFGNLTLASLEPLSNEHFDILLRFAKVFDLTYTRFNDLKQAEAQAKEARIEASLERVRARAMAMHTSQEIKDVAWELRNQMGTTAQSELEVCAIHLYEESPDHFEAWAALRPEGNPGNIIPFQARFPKRGVKIVDEMMQAYHAGKKDYVLVNEGEKIIEWFEQLKEQVPEGYKMLVEGLNGASPQDVRAYWSMSDFQGGSLVMTTYNPPNEEARQLLRRFSNVFGLAYRRFVDLKQAEAQTREAQIELALERVRARTMAMHKSEELAETAQVLFQQLSELGGIPDRIAIGIADEVNGVVNFWTTDQQGSHLDHSFSARLNERTTIAKTYQAWKEQKKSLVVDLHGEELKEWIQFAREEMGIVVKGDQIKDRRVHTLAFFSHGWILVTSHELQSIETAQILERFASVFNLTYRRFLDLKKAEAQAREAQIELSLERIRAKTMAMHQSEELVDTSVILFQELKSLGLNAIRTGVAIIDDKNETMELWSSQLIEQKQNKVLGVVPMDAHPFFTNLLLAWRKKDKNFSYEMKDDEVKIYYDTMSSFLSYPPQKTFNPREIFNPFFFPEGSLTVVSHQPLSIEERSIMQRFAGVFGLLYRRFLDLQKAEAQANEARIEIALERIRARALAMHKSDELIEVAKVLWEQMTLLGQRELEASAVHLYEQDPNHIHSWRAVSIGPDANPELTYGHMAIPKNSCELVREWLEKFYSNSTEYTIELIGTKQEEWYDLLFKLAPDVANSMRQKDDVHEKRYYRFSKFSGGALLMISKQEPSTQVGYLQKRAAVVFDLAYRRFLDLQKAEAQAREAQIEAALEKVRSHTMGMRSSEDLANVAAVMFDQMRILGGDLFSFGIVLCDKHENMVEQWHSIPGAGMMAPFFVPVNLDHIHQYRYDQWKSGTELFSIVIPEDYIAHHFELMLELPSVKAVWGGIAAQGIALPPIPTWEIDYGASFRYGYLLVSALKPFEEDKIFPRFAKVFEQAYTRFLDLQKAEAQAKEAQIEASLERVRSKTMAMHNSQDVGETVATMFDQLVKLGVVTNRCGILIFSQTNNTEVWTAKSNQSGEAALIIGHLDVTIHPMLQSVRNAWKNKETFFSYELAGDDIKNYYSIINNYRDYPTRFNLDSLPEKEIHSDFFFPEGAVFAFTSEPIAEEAALIFKRFAGVFGQTYRRYLDLQKAEAQAREALIEAGLERVRATTMAMHSSEDVSAATATMFTELEKLGIQNLRGGITIIKPDQTQEVWGITNLPDGRTIRSIGVFDMRLHPFWREIFEAFEKNEDYQYYWLAGKDKEDYIAILNATPNYLAQPIKEFPDVHVQSYFFGDGGVWTNSLQPHSEEDKQVMKRFASVFSLTFRRYQDLKKAEAQAREATIEAALERVRGKAMAMHSSKDLATTIGVFYHELEGLNLTPRRCGVGLIDKETMTAEISTMNASADGEGIELVGTLDLRGHPVLTSVYYNWLAKTEYHPVLRGNEIKEYYQVVRPQIDFPDYPNDTVQYGYFFFFEEGGVYAWTEKELNEDELKIYRRFTSVLSLTYKRYKDLKDAEARTQAAIKDAALDRIRADIASMRTINDLDRITPLIWNELTVLGVPFIRCGVFIMDEEQELIHTFLSTPDGKAIAAFHLPYDTPGNLSQVLTNWKENRNYIDRWDESEFKQFADILVKQGTLASADQYLKTIPHGGFYLHFLPFLQGMLYVGNTTQLNNDEIELIQHVADAFSTAYARYEDFNKLEAAKQQVDKTLTDLKQAQTQLVQSEKMASLGELTAGIAHEIQNPLNFVNNFSDVSNELLEEMKIELEKGNKEDAIAIVEDVKQNLEKILHHGKRADAIVKGMLQHSRTSSGQKEPTDVNSLADEYLRLAFHGLRAKDKSFNAKFETEFDNSIEKINIIPQDIGRVILNLINNAFYAVTEKKKINTNGYEPVVTVTTKRDSGKIEIKVRDNGNGIPQKNLDKIFQPFFTTKPTGQGTGLGLSLAYDIVTKGHGGELKVETREGEGSEFIIQLPVTKTTES